MYNIRVSHSLGWEMRQTPDTSRIPTGTSMTALSNSFNTTILMNNRRSPLKNLAKKCIHLAHLCGGRNFLLWMNCIIQATSTADHGLCQNQSSFSIELLIFDTECRSSRWSTEWTVFFSDFSILSIDSMPSESNPVRDQPAGAVAAYRVIEEGGTIEKSHWEM